MVAMRRLLDIVRSAVRRPFGSWKEFGEYLVFLGVCVAGVFRASWLWIAIGTMLLFLLTWPRWRPLVAQAGRIDRQYMTMGRYALKRAGLVGMALKQYMGAHHVALVLGAKWGQDALFLGGAYIFGMAMKWFWFDFI